MSSREHRLHLCVASALISITFAFGSVVIKSSLFKNTGQPWHPLLSSSFVCSTGMYFLIFLLRSNGGHHWFHRSLGIFQFSFQIWLRSVFGPLIVTRKTFSLKIYSNSLRCLVFQRPVSPVFNVFLFLVLEKVLSEPASSGTRIHVLPVEFSLG